MPKATGDLTTSSHPLSDAGYHSKRLLIFQVETELRQLGFGYRAKFIQKSAAQIMEWGGEQWFENLRDMKYSDAKLELMKLCGIGPKASNNYTLIVTLVIEFCKCRNLRNHCHS